jgi:serine/threonine protein kinase/tetratricopeptide (TPR) repeat protein
MSETYDNSDPMPGDVLDGHRITGILGKGGMAVVYAAVHAESGEQRAVKLMSAHAANEEVRARFQREYRALSQLGHPNVARVYGAGLVGDRPYYVMERIEGHDLRAEIDLWKELPAAERFRRVEDCLLQVSRALVHIHAQGFVHRDLSPSNIMITKGGQVKVMDFGVVKEPGTDLTSVGEMVGTVAYMAPEQFVGQTIDERADLYSLGVVLYLMLTGTRPFHSRNVAGYIDKHLHQAPRPPHEIVPSVPRNLEEACLRLLTKDPAGRFASASHLLNFLESSAPASLEGPGSRWPRRTVGRAGELARLREAISLVDDGRGDVILLEGPTGSGKSRLLDDLAVHAEERDLRSCRGQCRSDRPFSGYAKVYEQLAAMGTLKAADATRRAFEVGDETAAPLERYAVYAGFLDLMRRGDVRVVLIDNLHRADSGTLELTEYLVRNLLGLAQDPVLFVLTRLPAEVDPDPLQGLLSGDATGVAPKVINLGPLSVAAVEDLVLELVPADPNALALSRRLHDKSEGNPHFVVEMIRGLWDERIIHLGSDGRNHLRSDIDRILDEGLPVPASIRHALRERLAPLAPEARRIAATIAVARQEVSPDFLFRVADGEPDEILARVDSLVEAGIIRTRRVGTEERFELVQAALRDVLVSDLSDTERRALHRRIGSALERIHRRRIPSVIGVLAYHFEQADVPAKAFPYLLRSGEQLLSQSFVSEALETLDRALRLEAEARDSLMLDESDRLLATLLLNRSRAHAHLGHWAQADSDAQAAHRIALELKEPRLLAQTHFELGAMHRRHTDLEAAEEDFRQALLISEKLGDATLRVTATGRIANLHWARGNLDAAKRCWVEVLALGETTRDQRSLGAGYSGLGLMAVCRGQSADARKHLDQAARVYEELGALDELLSVRINLIELFHLTGNLRKGLTLADKTVAQAREIRHREGLAIGLRFRAYILTDLGRIEEARSNVEEALANAEASGFVEEELGSRVFMARIALAARSWDEAETWIDTARPLLDRYDTEGFRLIVLAWRARLCAERGDADGMAEALSTAEDLEGRRWPIHMVRFHIAAARALLTARQKAEARSHAHAALEIAEVSGFRFYTFKAHSILTLAMEQAADGAQHRRIAQALLRSLAATMTPEESEPFLDFHSGEWAKA